MISLKIEINEVIGKGFTFQIIPDESQSTKTEKLVGRYVFSCVSSAFELLIEKSSVVGSYGEIAEFKNEESIRRVMKERMQKYFP